MSVFRKKKKQLPRVSRAQEQRDTPAPMFSYHARRDVAQSSERSQADPLMDNKPATKRQHSRIHNLPTIAAIIVIFIAVGYSLTLSSQPKVVILGDDFSSNLLRGDATMYQKLMQSELESSLLYRSKITLDTNKLTRSLKQKYPEFSDLAVVIPVVGRRPVIQVKPTKVVLVLNTTNGSYIIDKEGRAIIKVEPGNQSSAPVPTVTDQTGASVTIGQNILPKQTLNFMDEVIGQFKSKNQQIEGMTLPALANELHVKLTGQPYYIKFNMEGDARQQVGTYLALQEKLITDKITPAEYVDVRVDEKAFYR